MQILPYEIVNYDENVFTIRGENGQRAEFLTEYQVALWNVYLEKKSWAPVFFPPSCISTKSHQQACLDLLKKLKAAGVISAQESNDPLAAKAIRMEGLHSLSAAILGLLHRPFAIFTPMQMFFVLSVCLLATILFFPLEANFTQGYAQFPLAQFLVGGYFTVFGVLSLRSLLQVAGLRRLGRVVKNYSCSFAGPFFYFNFDRSEFILVSKQEKNWLHLVGIFSPFILTAFLAIFYLLHLLPASALAIAALFSILTVIVLIVPYFPADGAALLQVWLSPKDYKWQIDQDIRGFIAGKNLFNKQVLVGSAICAISIWLYTDILRAYFSAYAILLQGVGLAAFSRTFANLLILTPFFFVLSAFLDRFKAPKKSMKSVEKVELPASEQWQALENIPLFLALSEADRKALFQEMELIRFTNDQLIIQQGDVGDAFYVMVKGRANTIYVDVMGREYKVGRIRSGDAFGEISLIDAVPRTASVITEGEAFVLKLHKNSFEKFVASVGSADRMKQIIRLTSFLRQHPLFQRFPATITAQMIDSLRYETVSAEERIKVDAQTNRQLYLVFSGKLQADTGDDYTDQKLEADDCFGYLTPGQTQLVELSVKAKEGSGLLAMPQDKFHGLIWLTLDTKPEILYADR